MARIPVDWTKYRQTFPKRYTKPGLLDNTLEALLDLRPRRSPKPIEVLDVGGGEGTPVLKKYAARGVDTWLLDPAVPPASWMCGSITWKQFLETPSTIYDIIVCRGSLNYLLLSYIEKLFPRCDVFIANTFIHPPPDAWSSRSVEESDDVERFRFRPDTRTVEHELVTDNGVICHSFWWHKETDLRAVLPGAHFQKHGRNSMLITHPNLETLDDTTRMD